ncbi:unnamed protein product, partial [Porites evermanni]
DKEIKILAEYLYQLETGESKVQKTEELICEWRKFKYSILKLNSEMPANVGKPPKNKELTSQTPTDWLLHHMLSNQSTYSHIAPELLCLAKVCIATSSNCPTTSNAAVQVDMLPPLALDVPEQVNAMGDGIGVENLEKEVNSVISALKLLDISDMDDSHSDYDSDFESDSD